MKVPPEAEELIYQLQADYPRAAAGIRSMWGPEKDSLIFFKELLTYQADSSKQGFSPESFKILSKIRDMYIDQYVQFKCINLSKFETAQFHKSLMDVWDRVLF